MERESEASLTPTHIWCLSSVGKVAIRIHSLGYSSYRLRWEHDTQEDTLIFYAMTGVEVPDVAMLNTLPPISGQAVTKIVTTVKLSLAFHVGTSLALLMHNSQQR